MADRQSAEQIREEHLHALGSNLGPVYNALYNEVIWLHAKWSQYRTLFGTSPERVRTLNEVAGFFFRVLQDVLWEDIILHIARLTDSPKSCGNNNLTLSQLSPAIQEQSLATAIEALAAQASVKTSFAKEWRNRHLAHRDLALAVDGGAKPLPGINRQSVEEALAAIRAVLNRIEDHFWQSEVAFASAIAPDDAKALIYHLEMALRAETYQRRLAAGSDDKPGGA